MKSIFYYTIIHIFVQELVKRKISYTNLRRCRELKSQSLKWDERITQQKFIYLLKRGGEEIGYCGIGTTRMIWEECRMMSDTKFNETYMNVMWCPLQWKSDVGS